MTTSPKNPNLFYLSFVYCLFLGFLFGVRPIVTYDIGWLLSSGQWIVENLSIPSTDVFSYTKHGARWIHHEWLSSVFIYLLFQVGGPNALIVMQSVLLGLILFVAWLTITPHRFYFLTLLLLAYIIHLRVMPRPHLMATLLFAILFLLLQKLGETKSPVAFLKKWAGGILLMLALWANLHGSALIAFLLLNTFIVIKLTTETSIGLKTKALTMGMCMTASFLALMMSPHTYHIVLFPFEHANLKIIMSQTSEFVSSFDANVIRLPAYQLYFFILALTASVTFFRPLALNKSQLCLGLMLAVLSLKYSRFMDLFVLWALPSLARHFLPSRLLKVEFYTRTMAASLILTFLMVGVPVTWNSKGWRKPAWGMSTLVAPDKGVELLKINGLTDRVFHNYELGSYLMTQKIPVFMDPRTPVYGDDFFSAATQALYKPDVFEALDKKWNFTSLIFSRSLESVMLPLHFYLLETNEWIPIYSDPVVWIYARKSSAPELKEIQSIQPAHMKQYFEKIGAAQ